MGLFTQLWDAIRRYIHHDDPRAARANLVALVVASNQPFYPIYLYFLVGPAIAPSFWTFLSTPFFLAVPALSRRNSLAGRALLPIAGIANTALSAKAFGTASGVELFLIPCALLAALLFRKSERLVALALVGAAFLVFQGLHDRYGAPFHLYDAAEYASFLRLNALSVGTLTVFIGFLFSDLDRS